MFYLDIADQAKVTSAFAQLRGKCPAAKADWDAQQAAADTPQGRYEAARAEVTRRLAQRVRWSWPGWGASECKVRHLTASNDVDAIIDLNQPIEVSTSATKTVLHFQCPDTETCIDNPSGPDANTALAELTGAYGDDVVAGIINLRNLHPACN